MVAPGTAPIDQPRPTPPDKGAAPRRTRWQRAIAVVTVLYAASIFALWAWMYIEGDRSWLATIFLFGPRWLCALPLPLVALCVVVWQRRLLWLVAATTVMIFGPLLGFHAHASDDGPGKLRVLTCNVNQRGYRDADLANLIDTAQPDVVALQEVKIAPAPIVWPRGWQVVHRDELLVASRFPVELQEGFERPSVPGKTVAFRYKIAAPGGDVQLFNLHLMTPRWGLEAVLDRNKGVDLSKIPRLDAMLWLRAAESQQVSDWIAGFEGAKIIVGDFNMPFDSAIFRRNWSGYENAFSTAGFGFGFTKMTEKRGWSYGSRIDHILYTPPWHCKKAWVDADIGSDHLPLLATFD